MRKNILSQLGKQLQTQVKKYFPIKKAVTEAIEELYKSNLHIKK